MTTIPYLGIELPDARTEAGTDRDGVLSYAGEYHAVVCGTIAGYATASDRLLVDLVAVHAVTADAAVDDIRANPWYAVGGIAAGRALAALDARYAD